jgi:hypothetical protein
VNWYQLFAGALTGAGLIGCILASVAYQIRSRGSWRRYPEGRWFMTFFINMGLLFALVLSIQIFGEWFGRRAFGIVVYAALIGLVWSAVRLLFAARERMREDAKRD